jgi:hypothetical protein
MEEDKTPTEELQPMVLSKNAGNTFLAVIWDCLLHQDPLDVLEMHKEKTMSSLLHKKIYNETFNYNSRVDILFSYLTLSGIIDSLIWNLLVLFLLQLVYTGIPTIFFQPVI